MPWSDWQVRPMAQYVSDWVTGDLNSRKYTATGGGASWGRADPGAWDSFVPAAHEAAHTAAASGQNAEDSFGLGTLQPPSGLARGAARSGWRSGAYPPGWGEYYESQVYVGAQASTWRGVPEIEFSHEPRFFWDSDVARFGEEGVDWGWTIDPETGEEVASQWENTTDFEAVSGSGILQGLASVRINPNTASTSEVSTGVDIAVVTNNTWPAQPLRYSTDPASPNYLGSLGWDDNGGSILPLGRIVAAANATTGADRRVESPNLALSQVDTNLWLWDGSFPTEFLTQGNNFSITTYGVPDEAVGTIPPFMGGGASSATGGKEGGIEALWSLRLTASFLFPRWRYWIPGGRPPMRQRQRPSGSRGDWSLRQRQSASGVARFRANGNI